MEYEKTNSGRAPLIMRLFAALVSGLLLSTSFPPLELPWMAWFALVPLLLLPFPKHWAERLLDGYLLGYAFSAASLLWLNEVGFGAGFLLALYCALFPMAWYALLSAAVWHWRAPDTLDHSLSATGPAASPALLIFGTAFWIALEWLRSWLLSGFPWDQLGVSQFLNGFLLPSAAWTGVYGISALLILTNLCLAAFICKLLPARPDRRRPSRLELLIPPGLLLLAILPFLAVSRSWRPNEGKSSSLSLLAIQGNIPQCRFWTDEEFDFALETYISLTKQGCQDNPDIDLVIWPESAVPASLGYPQFSQALVRLQSETGVPLLLGAITAREAEPAGSDPAIFNSAILLNKKAAITDCYDKQHLVPFGEFVPGGRYFPWLVDLIGMGRDLTPGRSLNLLSLPHGLKAGVNICFEDVFPDSGREFTKKGADFLISITNDSWYNESSGARQHLSHVVFRAVECRRYILRSGNNSHTCLISPGGEIMQMADDPQTGNPFYRTAARFDLNIPSEQGLTFYTRHGNLFAHLCALASLGVILSLAIAKFRQKKLFFQIRQKNPKQA